MAGEIGIGNKVIYEPILTDSSGLLPGSWDIITETGFGAAANILSEAGLVLKLEAL